AEGATVVRGAAELRVKESDRIATMATGLRTLGARVDETDDGATIHGGAQLGSGAVDSHGDHRIAMSFAIAAQLAAGEVRIRDVDNVATSFPGFDALAREVGFGLRTAQGRLAPAGAPGRAAPASPAVEVEVHRHLDGGRDRLAIAHGRLEGPAAHCLFGGAVEFA